MICVVTKNENKLLEVSWTERNWWGKEVTHVYEFLGRFWVKKNTGCFADAKTQNTILKILCYYDKQEF